MFLSDFLSSANTASTSFTAGEAVAAGQVAVLGADGFGYYAVDPATPFALARPIFNATAQQNLLMAALSAPFSGVAGWTNANPLAMAILTNGNTMVAWSNGTNILFGIYSPAGVLQGSATTVAGSTVSTLGAYVCACALSGGGFAICWYAPNGTSATPSFAIFNNAGGVVTGVTVVDASAVGGPVAIGISITALTGGGFVVAALVQ